MAITEIQHFHTKVPFDHQGFQEVANGLRKVTLPKHLVLGTYIEDESNIQITMEKDYDEDVLQTSAFKNTIPALIGQPTNTYHVSFDRGSAFDNSGPATANLVEYAQMWFPVSKATADFRKQIEDDFAKFDAIFQKDGKHPGQGSLATGWIEEEQTHPDIQDEKAKCFLVTRGWDAMKDFQNAVQTKAFEDASPILFAWEAPFKMVS